MMKNKYSFHFIAVMFFCIVASFSLFSQEKVDKDKKGFSEEEIKILLSSFNDQEVSNIKPKIDFIIKTGKDSAQMTFIASYIFDYYYTSNVMGDDELAIYVAENYFINKKLKWPNDETLPLLKVFVEYNKSSLIGKVAPDLNIESIDGNSISTSNIKSNYKILLFYDDECSVCKDEIPALMNFLKECKYKDISIIRVYTQSNREKWVNYVSNLKRDYQLPATISEFDLWDPERNSNFPILYGVLSTPQLLLIDKNNVIVGRGLNAAALAQVLDWQYNKPTENQIFFKKLFDSILPDDSTERVDSTLITSTIDSFYEKTKNNPTLFREIFMDLYQFLKKKGNIQLQDGAAYIGYKYISSMPQMWENDSLVTQTYRSVLFYYQNRLGEKITDLSLTDLSNKPRTIYETTGNHTVLFFYNMSCPVCEASAADIFDLFKKYSPKGLNVIAIYTGKDKRAMKKYISKNKYNWLNFWDKNGTSGMYDKYNLSVVPSIYLLDKEKTIIAKEISPIVLKELIEDLYK